MIQVRQATMEPIGSAVLVHGGWGNPDDWTWVRRLLESAGVDVATPDLPTHRSTTATRAEDADEVRRAIRALRPPVVAVGWSYGGEVASVAADGESSVAHLVLVATVPAPVVSEIRDASWVDTDPHVVVGDHGAFVIDNRWWLETEAQHLFSGEVLEHLREHPRRMGSRSTATEPFTAADWQALPTTVLIGRRDHLISDTERAWVDGNLPDVRHLETDHFIPFHQPETIAQVVLEAIHDTRGQGAKQV